MSARAAKPSARDVSDYLIRSTDWQLQNPSGVEIPEWVIAPLYDGLIRTSPATGESDYLKATLSFGQQAGWMPYNADDHTVGHDGSTFFCSISPVQERLEPMKEIIDFVIANPQTNLLDFREIRTSLTYWDLAERWNWIDTLYMAPPTLSRL